MKLYTSPRLYPTFTKHLKEIENFSNIPNLELEVCIYIDEKKGYIYCEKEERVIATIIADEDIGYIKLK